MKEIPMTPRDFKILQKRREETIPVYKKGGKVTWSLPYIVRKIKTLEKRINNDEKWIASVVGKLKKKGVLDD